VVLEQRPGLGRRQGLPHPGGAGRRRRALLGLEQLHHRGAAVRHRRRVRGAGLVRRRLRGHRRRHLGLDRRRRGRGQRLDGRAGTFTDTEGAGWIITSGTFIYQHYYLAEWRNDDGFDKGLRYAYDTTYQNGEFGDEWRVTRTPYNAPGMLVWYRDAQHTVNHVTTPIFARRAPAPRASC
jgi:hypothetical protein